MAEGVKHLVKLDNGVRARYVKSSCYSFCNPAFVYWREKGFYYAVGIKAASEREIMDVTNSTMGQDKR